MRLIEKFKNDCKPEEQNIPENEYETRVYYSYQFNEYIVKLFANGFKVMDSDYFTDDKQDAIETAQDMVKRAAKY